MMSKFFKHLRTVTKHRWHVFVACARSGYLWRGITHDLSKLSLTEFLEYAKYYEDGISPRDVALSRGEQFTAWQHHKGHNPHHWQYWIDVHKDQMIPLPMPSKYIAEMMCDWVGAGKAYTKGKWDVSKLKSWYASKRCEMMFNAETQKVVDNLVGGFSSEKDIYATLRRKREFYEKKAQSKG